MPNILLLYNRKSGRQNSRRYIDQVMSVFAERGVSVQSQCIDFGSDPFEGVENIDSVVVAGGDGTISYVINKMLKRGIDLPLGIIPIGTANDFATMLGIPHNPREAAQHILNAPVRRVDCGRVNGQFFVNVFSFGAFTTTSQHTPEAHKRRFGRLAYVAEGARELLALRPIPLVVVSDGVQFSVNALMALVFNGCTAGSFPLARGAKPDDGFVDVVIFEKRGFLRQVWDALRYLCGANPRSVISLRSRHLQITTELKDVDTDADGERGPEFPLDVECLPGALQIKG